MSETKGASQVKVGVVMGSSSDWDVMRHAADILTEFGIPFEDLNLDLGPAGKLM